MKEKRFQVLLQETINVQPDMSTVKEGYKEGTKLPVIRWKNVLTNTDKETANGNKFDFDDINAGIQKPFVQKRLKYGKFYNEYQHPVRTDPERYCMVYESEASDRITNFYFETYNGCKVLMGDCETATFGKGSDLRNQILSGAVPSKSLRASGEIYTDETGRSRKDLLIIAYDNVFMGADDDAWGIEGSFSEHAYSERLQFAESFFGRNRILVGNPANIIKDNGVYTASKKIWQECDFAAIAGTFKDIETDARFISESVGGVFKPNKVLVDVNGKEIVYISESSRVKGKLSSTITADINDFLRI